MAAELCLLLGNRTLFLFLLIVDNQVTNLVIGWQWALSLQPTVSNSNFGNRRQSNSSRTQGGSQRGAHLLDGFVGGEVQAVIPLSFAMTDDQQEVLI